VKYDTGFSRLSGSPETSVFNTFLSAFQAYLTLREDMTDKEAFDNLGVYGGDDGVTPRTTARSVKRAGKRLGLVMKVQEVAVGEWGVNFFNRYYTREVWRGDRSSSTDVRRMLSKLHLTAKSTARDFTPEDIFLAKMIGYMRDDAETHIVKYLVHYARRLQAISGGDTRAPRAYLVQKFPDGAYPNRPDPDHAEWTAKALPQFDEHALEAFCYANELPDLDSAPTCWYENHAPEQIPSQAGPGEGGPTGGHTA
jgi:hypothetical protein